MRRQQLLAGLPSTAEIASAPERAVLGALDTSIHLAIRALKAAHPTLESLRADLSRQPLLQLGEAILDTAACLHGLLADYDEKLDLIGPKRSVIPCTPTPADSSDEDIPF